MANLLMLILFVAFVAAAAECVRAHCRNQLRAALLLEHLAASPERAEREAATV